MDKSLETLIVKDEDLCCFKYYEFFVILVERNCIFWD